MQSEKWLLAERGSEGAQNTSRDGQATQPKGCLTEGRRDPQPYVQPSQWSGRSLESFCNVGVGMVSGHLVHWCHEPVLEGERRAEDRSSTMFFFLECSKGSLHFLVVVGGVLANRIRLCYICFDSSCFMFLL